MTKNYLKNWGLGVNNLKSYQHHKQIKIMKNFLKRSPVLSLSTFLILLSITVSVVNLLNQGFYFKKENVDLPNATKKLVVDTIKNEISFNAKCIHENCKKEVRNLENVLDEISYASQLGRLDSISLILAIFGLVFGFGAVAGFLGIKETSRVTAKEAATEWLDSKNGKKQLRDSVYEWIDKNPKEMDKIFIKAAKVVNKATAKAAPKEEISDSDEGDLIKAVNEKK